MFAAGEIGHVRLAAGREQEVGRGVAQVRGAAVGVQARDAHLVFAAELGPAVDDGHARVAQQVAVDAVEAADFGGALALERGPVQRGALGAPAVAARFFKGLGVVCGVAVELLRDTAHVHAGAAQAVDAQGLDQRHTGAALRGHARGAHATAAATDHQQIKIKRAHAGLSRGFQ